MKSLMNYLMLLSLVLPLAVKAETEVSISDELSLADEAIQSPPLHIEGQYQVAAPEKKVEVVERVERRPPPPAPKKLTASDRLKLLRERLEERNRIMVEKKMEQIRFQQEMALARQLESSMNQTLKAIDNVK